MVKESKKGSTNKRNGKKKEKERPKSRESYHFAKQGKSEERRQWADGRGGRLCMGPNCGNAAHRLRGSFLSEAMHRPGEV